MVKKGKKSVFLYGHKTLFLTLSLFSIVVIGLLAYSNTLNSPFLFDDQAHITENPHIRLTSLKPQNLFNAAFKSKLPERPVANISFAVNYFFCHYNVIGYHLTNIFIHIISAVFLFLLLKNTLTLPPLRNKFSYPQYLALAAALFWLLHPVQTQAITYIVQRMTSLASMFYIVSLYFYLKARLSYRSEKRSWPFFLASALSALLSFGCKEISATLPFFMLLYEWFFFQNLDTSWIKKNIHLVVAASFIVLILSFLYLSADIARTMAVEHQRWGFTIPERLLTEFRVIIFYISLLLYPNPARLNLDHDFAISSSLINPPQTLISIIVVLGLIISAFFLAKKYRILSFCVLFFFGNLFIESSFFGIELIYEHRLYLPSMFGIFAITCLLWNLLRSIPIKITAFSILACLLFIATYQRNKVWADELTLWQDCVAKSPDKPRANYNLATVLYERKDYSEAIKFYNKTLRLDPNRFDALEGLGLAYLSEENSKEALDYADKAIAMNPKSAHAYYVRGLALYRQNDLDQAIINFQKALAIKPTLNKIYNDLALVYYRQGKIEAAIAGWEKALQIEPDRPEALNNFAFCLATEPDERYRNPTRSCQLAEKACEVVRYQQPDLLDTLSIAYASAGRFEKAVTTAETAIKLAENKGNPELARQINERLLLYKNRQPYLVKRQTSTN